MARKEQQQDAVEASQEQATEQTPPDELEVRDVEGQTEEEAAGQTADAGFGGGEEGEADVRYSPGAETINPAFVTRNQEGSDN